MKTRLIVIGIVVVVVCVAAGTVFYLSDDEEVQIEGTWTSTIMGSMPLGELCNESGDVVIDLETWTGNESDLFTAWSEDGEQLNTRPYNGNMYWSWCTFEFYTEPGVTITADIIGLGVDESLNLEQPAEFYGYSTPYIIYEGEKLHNSLTTASVTTDSNGYAWITAYIVTDLIHTVPTILDDSIHWTCAN